MVTEEMPGQTKSMNNDDIDELDQIMKNVKSDSLSQELRKLRDSLVCRIKMRQELSQTSENPVQTTPAPKNNKYYKPLTEYSCSFTTEKITIKITLPVEMVENSLSKEITKKSIKVTMDSVDNKGFKFSVSNLADEIKEDVFELKVLLKFNI
ncbi:MAG: hypothetical protein MHPSP_002411 [Paramarteilia canceri]